MNQLSPVAECCVPNRPVPPPIARIVTGSDICPPLMKRYLGSWLTTASPAVGRKSANMISTIGRMPTRLIPSATPTNAFSQIGVLRTRSGPYFSMRPEFVLKIPPSAPTSSPISRTASSAAIASSIAAVIAWR